MNNNKECKFEKFMDKLFSGNLIILQILAVIFAISSIVLAMILKAYWINL